MKCSALCLCGIQTLEEQQTKLVFICCQNKSWKCFFPEFSANKRISLWGLLQRVPSSQSYNRWVKHVNENIWTVENLRNTIMTCNFEDGWGSSHSSTKHELQDISTTDMMMVMCTSMTWPVLSLNPRPLFTLTFMTATSEQNRQECRLSILNMLRCSFQTSGFLTVVANTIWHQWHWSRKGN